MNHYFNTDPRHHTILNGILEVVETQTSRDSGKALRKEMTFKCSLKDKQCFIFVLMRGMAERTVSAKACRTFIMIWVIKNTGFG